MAKFLTQAEVYRLIQRELPQDTYPDAGDPGKFFSTADSNATAKVIADAYSNMERIWLNNFPQTADERIADWEIKTFGYRLAGDLTLSERRSRVLGKLRVKRSLRPVDQVAIVNGILPGVYVELLPWGCGDGGFGLTWSIGESPLGVGTFLGASGPMVATGENLCEQSGADWGMTDDEWADYQEQAYTYSLRLYEYTPTADELEEINRQLDIAERATVQRVIEQNVAVTAATVPFLPPMEAP